MGKKTAEDKICYKQTRFSEALPEIKTFRLRDEKHTLSLRLDGILNKMVDDIKKITQVRSSQQVIRESIVVYDTLLSQVSKGNEIRIYDPETNNYVSLFEQSTEDVKNENMTSSVSD